MPPPSTPLPDTYVGYPQLDRIAFTRSYPKLKPARLLRLWYLAQELPRLVTREQLFAAWAPLGRPRNALRRDLQDGMGVYWRQCPQRIRIFPPDELHRRLGVELIPELRRREPLLGGTAAWHQSLVEGHVLSHAVHPDGKTDPLANQQIARATGFCVRTVRRQLRTSTAVVREPQHVDKGCFPPAEILKKGKRIKRPFFWAVYRNHVRQRLPDAFRPVEAPPEPGTRRTAQGRLLERKSQRRPGRGPGGSDLWDEPFRELELPPPTEPDDPSGLQSAQDCPR